MRRAHTAVRDRHVSLVQHRCFDAVSLSPCTTSILLPGGALPGARKHFETEDPAVRVRLALSPSDLDCGTEEVLVRAAIQVAVPEREHSANARDTRRLRRMAKTKGRFHVLPHPLSRATRAAPADERRPRHVHCEDETYDRQPDSTVPHA